MSDDSGIRELAGRYRLITPLGQRVMRGWDLHLRQVVAVRLCAAVDEPDQFVERASALTELSHPGLVRILDAGVADKEPFLVQEFIAGTTLRNKLTDGPLSANEVTGLGSVLGRALAFAHSQGVAHRDIHPGNILIGPGQEPYLTDVGIAQSTAVSYMAPEQASGGEPSMAADVYALGLVLLEALTGRTEYPGDDATTALARLSRAPLISSDLPHAATLRAMTSADPNDRPDAATCVDLLRGSSAKSRIQTRTVLVAAVAAAIAATGIMVMMNLPKEQQPLVEPREARVEQPRQTIPRPAVPEPTSTAPAGQSDLNIIEIPAAPDRPVQQQQQPTVPYPPTGQAPPPSSYEYLDQPVLLMPPRAEPPASEPYWWPWYEWKKAHSGHGKKPKEGPAVTPPSPPSPPGIEQDDEDD